MVRTIFFRSTTAGMSEGTKVCSSVLILISLSISTPMKATRPRMRRMGMGFFAIFTARLPRNWLYASIAPPLVALSSFFGRYFTRTPKVGTAMRAAR